MITVSANINPLLPRQPNPIEQSRGGMRMLITILDFANSRLEVVQGQVANLILETAEIHCRGTLL